MALGLRFGVQGLGPSDQGLGFMVQGPVFRVWGLQIRVWGLWSRVQGLGFGTLRIMASGMSAKVPPPLSTAVARDFRRDDRDPAQVMDD